jgi:hypothetical protein
MAKAELKFKRSSKIPLSTKGWNNFKKCVGEDFIEHAISSKSVYIIRLKAPFSIMYDEGYSPVLYIGRGDFQTRVTNHLKNWLNPLAKSLNSGFFEILFSVPKARNNVDFYKDVEADLIDVFVERYGIKPLNNLKRESVTRAHVYSEVELKEAFGFGKGNSFKWAIWPIGKNGLTHKAER